MTLSSDAPRTETRFLYTGQSLTRSPIQLPNSDCTIAPRVSLSNFTSFRVGGPAEWYVAPRNIEDMQASLAWAEGRSLPVTLLGAGSNMLASDRGIPGLTIATRHLRHSQFSEDGLVTANAGEPIARLAWRAAKRGWQGLEWAVGIPGTVGGSIVMNAGAHRACIADSLIEAVVLNSNGSLEYLTPEDLQFSYRTSILQTDKRLVVQATFKLQPGGDREEVMARTNRNLQHRKSTQPYHLPSCGSVFRNPESHAAGWLIEQTGLKGFQIGGAQVAHRHANFILNCDRAKAKDILQLIQHVQETVEQRWSLSLHPEVKLVGEF